MVWNVLLLTVVDVLVLVDVLDLVDVVDGLVGRGAGPGTITGIEAELATFESGTLLSVEVEDIKAPPPAPGNSGESNGKNGPVRRLDVNPVVAVLQAPPLPSPLPPTLLLQPPRSPRYYMMSWWCGGRWRE